MAQTIDLTCPIVVMLLCSGTTLVASVTPSIIGIEQNITTTSTFTTTSTSTVFITVAQSTGSSTSTASTAFVSPGSSSTTTASITVTSTLTESTYTISGPDSPSATVSNANATVTAAVNSQSTAMSTSTETTYTMLETGSSSTTTTVPLANATVTATVTSTSRTSTESTYTVATTVSIASAAVTNTANPLTTGTLTSTEPSSATTTESTSGPGLNSTSTTESLAIATVTVTAACPMASVIKGNMFLDVNQPALFVLDSTSTLAVAESISMQMNVPSSSVLVVLTLDTRRLAESASLRSSRRLQQASVVAAYSITVPCEGFVGSNETVTVSGISEKMTAVVSDSAVRYALGKQISSQIESGGYSVQVLGATEPTVESKALAPTSTTTQSIGMRLRNGQASFAHNIAVIGASHVCALVILSLSWLKQ